LRYQAAKGGPRRKNMRSDLKYGVQFYGYVAVVVARKKGGDVECATIDFVTGVTTVYADAGPNGGFVTARDLALFVQDLPKILPEVEELLKELTSSGGEIRRGSYLATLAEFPSEGRVIRIQISSGAKKHAILVPAGVQFQQVINQAKLLGNSIKRRPYEEYLDELAKIGVGRVESYGFALFMDGHLRFYPERRTLLVRPVTDNTFKVQELRDGSPSVDLECDQHHGWSN
jgi:hypothetical protein